MWKDGAWRGVCDPGKDTWDKKAGDAVCRELGFMESLNTFHGDTQLWTVSAGVSPVSQAVECTGGETALASCLVTPGGGAGCPAQNMVSVLCKPESRSACGPGATAMLGSCYKVFQGAKTFPDAQEECQKYSANLLEISDKLENLLVGTLIEKNGQKSLSFWTGGVVNEILNSKFKIWHGSPRCKECDKKGQFWR